MFARSSNLRSASYDPTSSSLTIEFQNGGLYVYEGVPETVFLGLVQAASAGRYHHQWIKDRYRSSKVR